MIKSNIKVLYNGDMKMVMIKEKSFDDFINNLRSNFQIEGNIKILPLNKKDCVINSFDQLSDFIKQGVKKFQLVDIKESINISKKIELVTSEHEETKSLQGQDSFQLNPLVLEYVFSELLTSETAVVSIMNFINEHRKEFLKGEYEINDYTETLKSIEGSMKEAVDKSKYW